MKAFRKIQFKLSEDVIFWIYESKPGTWRFLINDIPKDDCAALKFNDPYAALEYVLLLANYIETSISLPVESDEFKKLFKVHSDILSEALLQDPVDHIAVYAAEMDDFKQRIDAAIAKHAKVKAGLRYGRKRKK